MYVLIDQVLVAERMLYAQGTRFNFKLHSFSANPSQMCLAPKNQTGSRLTMYLYITSRVFKGSFIDTGLGVNKCEAVHPLLQTSSSQKPLGDALLKFFHMTIGQFPIRLVNLKLSFNLTIQNKQIIIIIIIINLEWVRLVSENATQPVWPHWPFVGPSWVGHDKSPHWHNLGTMWAPH